VKKLLGLIKKLLGMSGSSDDSSSSSSEKGFTLIELLIVIAILGVLAAGVLFAIDPVDRINSANDSRAQKDVASISTAAESYAATHNGNYPTTAEGIAILVTNGDLKVNPTAPTGYTYTYTGTAASFTMTGTLKSKKYVSGSYTLFRYDSSTGKACAWSGSACQP